MASHALHQTGLSPCPSRRPAHTPCRHSGRRAARRPLQAIQAQAAEDSLQASTSQSSSAPWTMTFDLRERETSWTVENKARLVKIVAREQLGISQEEMDDKMDILLTLVPDLQDRISTLRPGLLVQILSVSLDSLADRIIALKDLFPSADVGRMLGRAPALLLRTPQDLKDTAAKLRELLKTQHVDTLVVEQPDCAMNPACIEEVVSELQLLMPSVDPAKLLLAEPDWVLRAQRGQQWLGQNPDS